MNNRKGHYMKPGVKATTPGVVFTCVCHCKLEGIRGDFEATRRTLSHVAATVCYWRRKKWTNPQTVIVNSGPELLKWIASKADKWRVNWVFAPVATDFLTLIGWWHYVSTRGFVWRPDARGQKAVDPCDDASDAIVCQRLVVRGIPSVVDVRDSGIRFRFVSGYQYLPQGIEDAEEGRGSGEAERYRWQDGAEGTRHSPASDAVRWSEEIRSRIDWWRDNARSPWGLTIGQLSIGILRSHLTPGSLCTHNVTDCHVLEREASYGGRASLWFCGRIGNHGGSNVPYHDVDGRGERATAQGPTTLVDVRSMYPYLLRERAFPCKLISHKINPKPEQVFALAESFGVIARCLIRTRVPEYPCRVGDSVRYPTGQFLTTLTGPELLRLRDDGEIVKCHEMSTYHLGRPFASAAAFLLACRKEEQCAKHAGGESFVKLLSNSLGGKLAQRCGGWARESRFDQPGRWGELIKANHQTGQREVYRWLCGMCWRYSEESRGSGPYTFAFAYLAAYGRLMMRLIRERLPEQSVVSQDTDGLWVLPHALSVLESSGSLSEDSPGQLRKVRSSTSARFLGPRHYQTDGQWILAGFHRPVMDQDGMTVWDTFEDSLWGSRCTEPPNSTTYRHRRSMLKLDIPGGVVQQDGWIVARHIWAKKVMTEDSVSVAPSQSGRALSE